MPEGAGVNPWRELFRESDRMDLPKITKDQLNAGMTLCSTAFRARHGLIPLERCREILLHLRGRAHERLHPIVDRCLVEEPDEAEWIKVVDTQAPAQ